MGNNEDDFLMLSGLQHFQFCKRQWALIHIEQQWEENVKTIEGQLLHKKADQPFVKEKRGDKMVVRGLPIQSQELKLSGICDVVEFHASKDGVSIYGVDGTYLLSLSNINEENQKRRRGCGSTCGASCLFRRNARLPS